MLLRSGADGAVRPADLYHFGPGLTVCIRGEHRARAHFRAEYASAALTLEPDVPAVDATFGSVVSGATDGTPHQPRLVGTHKLARWRAYLPVNAEVNTLRVAVDVRGPLGLALVQSHVIEPLISLAAIRSGLVLLPGAAFVRDDRALLLIGRSRSGKTSLAARALAAGRRVLGDDQVLINAQSECVSFPRRLRLYPDLARTAPAAFAALQPSVRGRLAALGRVDALTRGFVAPPVSVSASALGSCTATPTRFPVGEVVVVHRAPVPLLTFEQLDHAELEAETAAVLVGQRSGLFSVPGVRTGYEALLEREREIIAGALASAPARRVLVPAAWTSEQAVGALARELELDS